MSGHSKWHNIKNTKGAQDAKKSALFSKLSKEIIISAQMGGTGDLNFNPYLRVAVNKAKAANMTSDRIEKAINKGLKKGSSDDNLSEKTYEAYGFDGVILLIDCESDNPNRTITELRTVITRSGGKIVPEGSLSWQFDEKGVINVKLLNVEPARNASHNDAGGNKKEELLLELISIEGVEDIVESSLDNLAIIIRKETLKSVIDKLKEEFGSKIEIEDFGINKIPKNVVKISDESMEKNYNLIEEIKENSDVVSIWDNIS